MLILLDILLLIKMKNLPARKQMIYIPWYDYMYRYALLSDLIIALISLTSHVLKYI